MQAQAQCRGIDPCSVCLCGKGFWDVLPFGPLSQASPEFLTASGCKHWSRTSSFPGWAPPQAVMSTSVLPS